MSSRISNNNFFDEHGYILIKNAIPQLKKAQVEIESIIKRAKAGDVVSGRSYVQYPKFIDGINISKIEYPWEECSPMPGIKSSIEAVDFDELFKNHLNLEYPSYDASSFAMNVTSKYFKYSQRWHRDIFDKQTPLEIISNKKPKSLRMNMYFFDESGFQLISKRHKSFYYDRVKEEEIWNESLQTLAPLKIAETIHASAGDILIFHPDLLHRGYCTQKRANFHLSLDLNNEIDRPISNNLPKNIRYKPSTAIKAIKSSPDNIIRIFINLCRYYLPIPSRNYFRFLIRKPSYVSNKFIQRHSVYNKDP
ncbi:hypothetical protein N8708_05235 [Porticoccaceae bacterium]|nr:hypothetical protein [Porticoccaceae bacterium]